jgi:hypothetical protein
MCSVNVDDLIPQHQPKGAPEPQQESFVRDMVDPECCFQPPAVRVFVGYLGLSPRELDPGNAGANAGLPGKWVRLYSTLDFTDFIEVKWEDVVYHKKSTAAALPIEGTILWVRSDAKIWHTRVNSRSVIAGEFLRGSITDQQLSIAQPVLAGGPTSLIDTPSWGGPC